MEVINIVLQNFAEHLTSQNASDSTVKNYLADIGLFFRFLQDRDQPVSLLTLPHQLSAANVSNYHQYLISHFPSSTVKRRISSLNKFISFAHSSHPVIPATPVAPVTPTAPVVPISPAQLSHFQFPTSDLPSPLPPTPHPKPRFNYTFALFILLTISLSIIGGFVASQLTPQAPVGLVDPGVSNILH